MTVDRFQYQGLAVPPPAATEAPPLAAWTPSTPDPVRRPPRRPTGGLVFVAEPGDWPTPEAITLDKWFQPASEPVRVIPPRPHGGTAYTTEPTLIPWGPADGFPWPPTVGPLPRANLWRPRREEIVDPSRFRGRFYATLRGKRRTFGAACYRFYRSNAGPPAETDSPFATSASLPATPADTYADGTWYLSVSYFNGVLDSGFMPLGARGETYLRLDLAAGAEAGQPPAGPLDWRLEQRAGGVVRVVAVYWEAGDNRADSWAIAYSTDGGTPAADAPDVAQEMPTAGLAVLAYDLPAAADGTTVKVRLQTVRDTTYSEDSTVKTATADATGPAAPPAADRWVGGLPEDL